MEEAVILKKIRELHRRYRLTSALKTLCLFLLFGMGAGAVFLLFVKITGFFPEYSYLAAVPAAISILAGLAFHFIGKTTYMEVALKSDEQLHLKERLSTALEWIQGERIRTPMFRALLRDTARAAQSVIPGNVFPFLWKKQLLGIGGTAALLGILIWMPNLSLFTPRVDPKMVKKIQQEAVHIEKLAKALEKKKPRAVVSVKKFKRLEKDLRKLAHDLNRPDIQKRDALSRISRVQDSLKEDLAKKEEMEKFESEVRRSGISGKSENLEQETDALDELSRKLQEIARKLAEEGLTEKEKKELLAQLQQLQEMMKKAGMNTENIEKAIENMKKGDMNKAARNMQDMANQFQQRQREMEDIDGLRDVAGDLDDSKNRLSGQPMKPRSVSRNMKKGKGDFPGDFGKETTNQEKKSNRKPDNRYTKREGDKSPNMKSIYERLYNPQRDEFQTGTATVRGKITRGPVIKSIRTRKRGAPRVGDQAKVEAEETYTRYKAAGEEAVKKQKIPAQYRDLIRNYYDNIDPEK